MPFSLISHHIHSIDLLGQGRSSKPYFIEEKEDSIYRLYPTEDKSSNTIHDCESRIEMGKNSDTKVEYSINLWAVKTGMRQVKI